MANLVVRLLSVVGITGALWANPAGAAPRATDSMFQASRPAPTAGKDIRLKSRVFGPGQPDASILRSALALLARPDQSRVHLLVQLDFIPSRAAVAEYQKAGVRLLAYVPDYAWIASAPAANPMIAAELPGLIWAGALTPDDKLDPDIRSGAWGSWNRASDGTVAIAIVMHADETLETGKSLAAKYGARVVSEVQGLRALLLELPVAKVTVLAGEDAIQWIELAEPPLFGANDGIRQQIGVNTVQSAPYNLSGAGVDILIYDVGVVTPTHPDFSGRLTIGSSDSGSTVSDHATHVAGTAAGSGNQSASDGGSALQWRGMAPGADVISYQYDRNNTGMLFYNDPGDIESNWAAAQNTHGADVGNASLGSNIYLNYPMSCTLMGNYGLTSGLMDQIIRGGNSVVGAGDKMIATWAVGNERPSACSATGYGTLAPPASAKNPIHVGASNTNDSSMTSFSSWGPTDDGRIKPIVVAGGDQVGGDGGIKSTIPNQMVNSSASLNCDGSGDDYCYPYDVMQGTSMAAPAVAGSIALMLQEYRQDNLTSGNFWPATAKALLIQTASDLGNPGPDYQWGFGQVRIRDAVDLIARHGFFQNSVDQDETDLFIVQVTDASTPQLQISMAWDDYEATFNANPTLVNDLDVELIAPSGAIWRPWVLDPANPADDATRGVNTRDNQEQVTVPDPELGTWLVRVKGKTVPQGPQDYAIACDGCRTVVADVCQATAGKAPVLPAAPAGDVAPSDGDRWQRGLGAGAPALSLVSGARENEDGPAPARLVESPAVSGERKRADRIAAEMRAFDAARNSGPAAVLAFADTASAEARAMLAGEVDEAQARIAGPPAQAAGPAGFVLPWVGVNGACAYYTVQAAIDAAPNGATVRVSTGFLAENLSIGSGKVITIEGGWGTLCTIPGAQSRIDSAGAGSVIDVVGGARVKLSHLELGWGTGFGAGLDVVGSSKVTLDDTSIVHNNGSYGGGLYVGGGSEVTLTNGSFLRYNTASGDGGGAIVYGRLHALDTASDLTGNCAVSDGGGAAVPGGQLYLNGADVTANEARGLTGRGGGVYATNGGVVTLTNNVFIGASSPCCNLAFEGGGIYADQARIISLGGNTTILGNRAASRGGGVFLANGSVFSAADGTTVGYSVLEGAGNSATQGGGIYVLSSTLRFDGRIVNNMAVAAGAGIYASASALTLTGASVGESASLYGRNVLTTTGPGSGAGLYLTNNTQALISATLIASNTWASTGGNYIGGGVFIDGGSVLTLTNSRIERHATPATGVGRGAAIYINGGRVFLDGSQILSNTARDNGGGVRVLGGRLATRGALFANNETKVGEGGAIAIGTGAGVDLASARFASNTAASDGGAIGILSGGMTVEGSVFERNSAERGGAIFQDGTARSWISNTLVYSNATTAGFGAGIRNHGGAMTLTHVTLANNIGGAGFSPGSALSYVRNTIIWGNTTTAAGAVTVAACSIDQSGVSGVNVNPKYVNPGGGEDYRLRPGSPALDACPILLPDDLDGRARPIGSLADMGAYELLAWNANLPVALR